MGSSGEDSFFEAAERVAQIGSWEWTPETGELRVSDNVFRLYGLEPGAVAPSMEGAVERTLPDDVERHRRQLERIRAGADHEPFDYRIVRADGELRQMRLTVAEIEAGNGRPQRVLGAVQDVTESRAIERMIAAHIAVSDALAEWHSFDLGAELLLSKLGTAIEFEVGALWVPLKGAMVARAVWHADGAAAGERVSKIRRLRIPQGIGLVGEAWRLGRPVSEGDVRARWGEPRAAHQTGSEIRELVAADEVRGGVAVPAVHGDDVLAVLGFGARREIELGDRMPSLSGIGFEVGEFLAHHRGELGAQPLTPRELEVLGLGAQGNSRTEIADSLEISPATVKTHFEHIYAKLEVSDRAAAVARAVRDGLID